MEPINSNNSLLELLGRAAFYVKDGIIVQANEAAQQRFITVGDKIANYLPQNLDAYSQFTGGCLYLSVSIMDIPCGAAVTRVDDRDLFLLDNIADGARQAMALCAQQLRLPLNVVFSAIEDMKDRNMRSQINKGLNQMHRIICNMADLIRYENLEGMRFEATDLFSVFAETMDKVSALIAPTGVKLRYTALPQTVIGMADREMLERAIHNLVSNAVKFSQKGNTMEAKLTRTGDMLSFTLQDDGEGIPPEILSSIYFRFLREPSIEDSRHGVGLGMALVRSVATSHGGTVLIRQPETGGTQVTMTLAIRPCKDSVLHSPISIPGFDYAGGRDHSLMELSEILPAKAYKE